VDPDEPRQVNPYTLPAELQGWRGLGVPGPHKRKWYTLIQNDSVLVTALLLLPGEHTIRHSHTSGELSIRYDGELNPIATWWPPGVVHPPLESSGPVDASDPFAALQAQLPTNASEPMASLVAGLLREQAELRAQLAALQTARVRPRIIIDVLFPPFETTIDDPHGADRRTIVGQWYD
jgi:hypothetical protein